MELPMRYLHTAAPGVYVLDHRLRPEVSAMFCAMSSRMPSGGIKARYNEVVQAIMEGEYSEDALRNPEIRNAAPLFAEERLTKSPLHERVQGFFDKFVRRYGHSSIMELTGQPAVYTEGLSWYAAYLLFDSPLCSGQEFSTRAVRHRDWPMARECFLTVNNPGYDNPMPDGTYTHGNTTAEVGSDGLTLTAPHPALEGLHEGWFEIFEAEVEAWKAFFSDPDNRAAYGIKDKEPFRPALDRARWAIPGTIATGCAHTGHLRERARVLRDGMLLAKRSGNPVTEILWQDIRKGYAKALPGLKEMGLREAVYDDNSQIPGHLKWSWRVPEAEVTVKFYGQRRPHGEVFKREPGQKSYIDPLFNHVGQVDIGFECSLAVVRDWHRHRTMYPWNLSICYDPGPEGTGTLLLHPRYEPKSEIGKARVEGMLRKSYAAAVEFIEAGDEYRAMLCLPFGTRCHLQGQGGLRDVIYMLELRRDAHGANFEYQAQAAEAMTQLVPQLSRYGKEVDFPILDHLGFEVP
jgi:hypothetical protein